MPDVAGEAPKVMLGRDPLPALVHSIMSDNLIRKIESQRAVVSVIGLGYVGLPLAMTFAAAGFRVLGIDLDEDRVRSVNSGKSYVQDVSEAELALYVADGAARGMESSAVSAGWTSDRLSATIDYSALTGADVAIVCVPTPLSKTRDPDLSHVIAAADEIARYLHPDMLVVLESTTYPGTTEEVILPRLENADAKGLTVGEDFYLAFSPERVDPGQSRWTVKNTPKVVGGMTPACGEMVKGLYEQAIDVVVPVSSPQVAEMVKLLENTFRATNIALVNEIAMMCDRLGVDVWEAIDAAKTKPFGFMPFYPGPGLGGHCIPVDPQFLAWKLKTLNYNARFIQLAAEINLGMPGHVLGKIADALNDAGKPLNGSRVLLLGVAYKANVSDTRESPALDLIQLLRDKGSHVTYNDPYVREIEVDGHKLESISLDDATLRTADCVVITTDHKTYDWQRVVDNSRLVVDTRNATGSLKAGKTRVARV